MIGAVGSRTTPPTAWDISLPYQSRKYANPPIIEALVDFGFEPTGELEETLPEKLQAHQRLNGLYEGSAWQQQVWRTHITAAAGQLPNVSVGQVPGRVVLQDTSGARLITLGRFVMSVNSLKPYEGWSEFRPRIEAAVDAYADLTGAKRIVRIGVRYINRLQVTGETLNLSDYLTIAPPQLPGVAGRLLGHSSQTELAIDATHWLRVIHAVVRGPDGLLDSIMLDVDALWQAGEGLEVSEAMAEVDRLHVRECTAFEASITDTTRELFGGDASGQ